MARVEDNGYYSSLGLQINATEQQIGSAYKKKALSLHPDRNRHDPDATTRFQQLVTAYHVLRNQQSREGYDRILELRTFMYQQANPDGLIDPYLIFSILKKNKNKKVQPRILTFDFVHRVINNYEKDKLRKRFSFDALKEVETLPKKRDLILHFRDDDQRPYHYKCFSDDDRDTVVALFQGILSNSLHVKMDDFPMPPLSLHKGEVDKKKKMGGWARRHIMCGSSCLLIFRDSSYSMFVNSVRLVPGKVSLTSSDDFTFTLENEHKTQHHTFKCDTKDAAFEWRQTLRKILKGRVVDYDRRVSRYPLDDGTVTVDKSTKRASMSLHVPQGRGVARGSISIQLPTNAVRVNAVRGHKPLYLENMSTAQPVRQRVHAFVKPHGADLEARSNRSSVSMSVSAPMPLEPPPPTPEQAPVAGAGTDELDANPLFGDEPSAVSFDGIMPGFPKSSFHDINDESSDEDEPAGPAPATPAPVPPGAGDEPLQQEEEAKSTPKLRRQNSWDEDFEVQFDSDEEQGSRTSETAAQVTELDEEKTIREYELEQLVAQLREEAAAKESRINLLQQEHLKQQSLTEQAIQERKKQEEEANRRARDKRRQEEAIRKIVDTRRGQIQEELLEVQNLIMGVQDTIAAQRSILSHLTARANSLRQNLVKVDNQQGSREDRPSSDDTPKDDLFSDLGHLMSTTFITKPADAL